MDASQQYVSQKVFNFADDADPLGKRTIGVLTKCDRVPLDERDALDTVSMPSDISLQNLLTRSQDFPHRPQ